MKRSLFFLLLMVVFSLAACSALPEMLPFATEKPVDGTGDYDTPVPAEIPLEGAAWELVSMSGQPVLESNVPTIKFENGNVGGSAGCNSFGGEYEVKGDQLSVGKLMSTLMACAEENVNSQESTYLKLLGEVHSYKIEGSALYLITTDGSELVFTPQK